MRMKQIAGAAPQFQMRSAIRTGVWLRMETPVARVVIFGLTKPAHDEAFHRSVGAVVGQRLDDAEPRSAIGAVRERIAVAPVGRVEEFAHAVRAGRDVRQHQGAPFAGRAAGANFESLVTRGIQPERFEALDETARRPFCFEAQKESDEQRTCAMSGSTRALRSPVALLARISN